MAIASDGEKYTFTKTCPKCGLIMGNNDHAVLKYHMVNHTDKCDGTMPAPPITIVEKPAAASAKVVETVPVDTIVEKPVAVSTKPKPVAVSTKPVPPSPVVAKEETVAADTIRMEPVAESTKVETGAVSTKPIPPTLASAICEMQKTKLFALTDSTNPFFKSKYSDLSSVWAAIREPLTANGLSIVQTTKSASSGVTVVTTLLHVSGENIVSELSAPLEKQTIQGLGSAITYLRRYSLMAICGVSPADDDGEGTMMRGKK